MDPHVLKYVVVLSHGMEVPILLTQAQSHADVVGIRTAVSAGFCQMDVRDGALKVMTFGESVSLGRHGRPEDGPLIERLIFPPR